jgi:hypothetical protein
MKNSIFAASILVVALAVTAPAQVNPAISAANPPVAKAVTAKPDATPDAAKATRARVLNQTQKSPTTSGSSANDQTFQAHAKANFKNRARLESLRPEISSSVDNTRPRSVATGSNAHLNDPKSVTSKNAAVPGASLIANATAVAVVAP